MFEDILGIIKPQPTPYEIPIIDFNGCPFCGESNMEEDGSDMVCNNCSGKWTVENENLEIKK